MVVSVKMSDESDVPNLEPSTLKLDPTIHSHLHSVDHLPINLILT